LRKPAQLFFTLITVWSRDRCGGDGNASAVAHAVHFKRGVGVL